MSMILQLTTLGDANIDRVMADPPLVWKVIAPDDPDVFEQAQAALKPSLLGRLFGKKEPPPADRGGLALGAGEGASVDLDKAWHGIHYLLTGTAWEGEAPLHFLAAGGRPVGDIDVGYGPVRAFSAAETRAIHDALTGLGDDDLRARFDPADMMEKEIYPEIWDRPAEEDDTLGYLVEHLQLVRKVVADAAAAGHGMLVSLS
jgi:hypothetical protein